MIEVNIDLVPFGEEKYRQVIGAMTIINDGTGDYEVGSYDIEFGDGMKVRVENHERWQDIYTLLYKALLAREEKKICQPEKTL